MDWAADAFFASPHPDYYLEALLIAMLAGYAWVVLGCRARGLTMRAGALTVALCAVLGAFFGRLLYLAVDTGSPALVAERFFKMEDVREMGFVGVLLGAMLGAYLGERLFREKGLMNAMAAPALMVIALARFAECFVPFGTGSYVEQKALQWVPFAMPDGFDGWVLSVYLWEGLWALFALAVLLVRRPRHACLLMTALFASGQIFFESLRAETLQWGFVRVSQVLSALMVLAVLLRAGRLLSKHGENKGGGIRLAVFALLILLYTALEFAYDRMSWPHLAVRAMMALTAAGVVVNALSSINRLERVERKTDA